MTPQQTIAVGLVGIGGYGGNYLDLIRKESSNLDIQLVGAVDPYADRSPHMEGLRQEAIPVYADLEGLYEHHTVDLLIVVSPIHHHMAQTRLALRRGSNVLCEKPLAATVQDGLETLRLEQESAAFVAVGYNWSYTRPIQTLKENIAEGLFGAPLRLKSLTLWPRGQLYYTRNRWAGRITDESGAYILDSPLNNATAHHLHNMFYLLGESPDQSAQPVSVGAELYRANAIENYDTAAMRALTASGAEILFYTAHPVEAELGPIFHFQFEDAVITYSGRDSQILAQFHDGRVRSYGNPEADAHAAKLGHCVAAIRRGERPLCGIEAALAQTRCMNGVQESSEIHSFPQELRHNEGERGWIEGLSEIFFDCYQKGILPAERGDIPWARAGKTVDLRGYDQFPSRG
ncbi:MAG: Gfo/Idh/MocA family oxidoreductase [Caldilineaceae bacterium]|nr:Gfo/Idh/MocA family oxidoreductase [Caldilineaceae bacterium]